MYSNINNMLICMSADEENSVLLARCGEHQMTCWRLYDDARVKHNQAMDAEEEGYSYYCVYERALWQLQELEREQLGV